MATDVGAVVEKYADVTRMCNACRDVCLYRNFWFDCDCRGGESLIVWAVRVGGFVCIGAAQHGWIYPRATMAVRLYAPFTLSTFLHPHCTHAIVRMYKLNVLCWGGRVTRVHFTSCRRNSTLVWPYLALFGRGQPGR